MDQYEVFSSFFFRFYAFLWRVVSPFLKRSKRLSEGWNERLAAPGWSEKKDVWIQAASGGEALLAAALLKALPEDIQLDVLVCTWTRQGMEVLEKAFADLTLTHPGLRANAKYAPLDAPKIVRAAVGMVRPKALILLETELWPGLLGACAELGIPVHALNARMSKASYELYRIIAPVLRNLPMHAVHAISNEDALRFRGIFEGGGQEGRVIDTMPNIKFDRAAEVLAELPANCLASAFHKASPIILLASVRQQEERFLAPLVGKLLQAYPLGVVVVAPRHMHRVEPWFERLHDLGLQPSKASDLPEGGAFKPGGAVLWDVFGDLPRLYATADAVFVGGSLGLGGQNFLESLSAGVIPCVGRSLENFRWALGEDSPPSLVDAGLLKICKGSKEIRENLVEEAATPPDRDAVRSAFLAWLTPHTGGSRLAANMLLEAVGHQGRGKSVGLCPTPRKGHDAP